MSQVIARRGESAEARKPIVRVDTGAMGAQGAGPQAEAPAEQELLNQLQAHLGNHDLHRLEVEGPTDANEAYLRDLLRVTRLTGVDTRDYLPWKAPSSWLRWVQPYYRVIWEERDRSEAPAAEATPLEAANAVTFAAPTQGAPAGSAAPAADDATQQAASPEGAVLSREALSDAQADGDWAVDWFERLLVSAGPGRPLSSGEQDLVREVHGRPLPQVRLHEGAAARNANRIVSARAFTVGTDIYLGEGLDVATPGGAELLVHEATHALQHLQGRIPVPDEEGLQVSRPSDPHEREAEARGQQAARWVAEGAGGDPWGLEAMPLHDRAAEAIRSLIASQLPAPDALPSPELLREGLARWVQDQAAAHALLREVVGEQAGADDAALGQLAAELERAQSAFVSGAAESLARFAELMESVHGPAEGDLAEVGQRIAPYPGFAQAAARELERILDAAREGDAPWAEALLRAVFGFFAAPGLDAARLPATGEADPELEAADGPELFFQVLDRAIAASARPEPVLDTVGEGEVPFAFEAPELATPELAAPEAAAPELAAPEAAAPEAGPGAAMLRRDGVATPEAPEAVRGLVARSQGRPADAALQARLSAALGEALPALVLHTDAAAARAAEALGARAFTLGTHLYFAEGAWAPGTPEGDALLLHEATHALQAVEGRLPSTRSDDLEVSSPSDAVEREAEAAAAQAAPVLQQLDAGPELEPELAPEAELEAPAPAVAPDVGVALREEDPKTTTPDTSPDKDEEGAEEGLDDDELKAALKTHHGIDAAVWPKLVENILGWLKKNGAEIKEEELQKKSKAEMIAEGRKKWKGSAGGDLEFLKQLAAELAATDKDATKKLGEIENESHFDKKDAPNPQDLKNKYYKGVANQVTDKAKVGEGTFIYSKDGSPMTDASTGGGGMYLRKGTRLEVPEGSPILYRVCGMSGFLFKTCTAEYRTDLVDRLAKLIDPAKGNPQDLAKQNLYTFWKYEVSMTSEELGRTRAAATGDLVGTGGTTWWSHVNIDDYPDEGVRKSGIDKHIDLLALEEDWYAEGAMKLRIDSGQLIALQDKDPDKALRKPTAFDGLLSPLWAPNTEAATGWGLTAKKVPEAVAPVLPSSLLLPGTKGLEPGAKKLEEDFDKLAKLMADYGNDAGKKKYNVADKPKFVTVGTTAATANKLPLKPDGGATQTFDAPGISHPGADVKKVTLTVSDDTGELKGGTADVDVTGGGAITKQGAKQNITPQAEGGVDGQIDTTVKKVDSPLKKLLKKLDFDAKLIDEGVEATVSLKEGEELAIPKFKVTSGSVTVRFVNGEVSAEGSMELAHTSGKMTATAGVTWDGSDWILTGSVTINELVDGLKPVTVAMRYEKGNLEIRADKVEYEKKLSAVTLKGTATNLVYESQQGAFSGNVALKADLGAFGEASATASIKDNALDEATFTYDTPTLRYPKEGERVFEGDLSGTITYKKGKLSGRITGTANFTIPGLGSGKESQEAGLKVDAKISDEGKLSGSIKSTKPLMIGEHFRLPSLSATLKEDGSVEAAFKVEVVDIKFLEKASVECKIDKDGFSVTKADVKVPFGTEGESRVWGAIEVGYAKADGFKVHADAHMKLGGDLVAHGTIDYSTKTQKISADFKIDDIKLLDKVGTKKTLVEFKKEIPVFSVMGIVGMYLDIGFDLAFQYSLKLTLSPEASLDNLSLKTFDFEKATIKLKMLGALIAKLMATPKLGVGLYVLHPKLIRGGGGISVPIVGEAKLTPTSELSVTYTPGGGEGGGLSGDAKVDMPLTFGVKGAVKPYAEFSLLDGAYDAAWEGDSLSDFEILPEKELFRFTMDTNNLKEGQEPTIPDTMEDPKPTSGAKQLEQDKATPKQTDASANKNATAQQGAPQEGGAEAGPAGLDFPGLIAGLLNSPGLATVKGVIEAAAKVWEQIKGFLGAIGKFFKNWFDKISETITQVLELIGKHGFFGFLKIVLKNAVGERIYHILEPLLNAFGGIETKVIELLDKPLPSSIGGAFEWMWDVLKTVVGISWSGLKDLVSAFGTMWSRAKDAAVELMNMLIERGDLGVKRWLYWAYIPWENAFGKTWFLAATEYKAPGLGHHFDEGMINSPTSAVGIVLWEFLEGTSVKRTNTQVSGKAGDPYNDYWSGSTKGP